MGRRSRLVEGLLAVAWAAFGGELRAQGLPGLEWREAEGERAGGWGEERGEPDEAADERTVWVPEFRGVLWESADGGDWRSWAGFWAARRVEAEVGRWEGRAMTAKDLETLLDAILEILETEGLPVVEAELGGLERWGEGWVTIRLTVGRYHRVGVTPVRWMEAGWLERSLRLEPGAVVTTDGLEREMEWLGRSPFTRPRLLVSPAETAGGVDVLLALEEGKPWAVELGYDTRLPEILGDHRMWLGATWVTPGQHLWGWQSQVSEDPAVYQAHALRWEAPWTGRREVWRLDLGWARVDTEQRVAGFPVDSGGESVAASWRWMKRTAGWRGWEPTVSLGVEYQRHDQFLLFGSSDLSAGQVEIVHGVAGVEVRKDWEKAGWRGDLQGLWGPGGIGGRNGDGDFERYEAGVDSTYRILRGGIEGWRRGDWGECRVRYRGQWSDGAMLPANQWVMGGAGSVRGAREREFLGDRGWQATLEYQTPWWDAGDGGKWSAVVFRDEARLIGGASGGQHPASAGLGLRWRWRERVEMDADYGWRTDGGGRGGVVAVRCRF